jgi:uncharacterized membrane-anchored protein YhcB (DUF1043 family)
MEVSESGLPKIDGLQAVAQDVMTDKGNEQQTVPEPQQTQTPLDGGQVDVDAEIAGVLKSFTNPDGSINVKNLAKSYKEVQGFSTKTAQERALKEQTIEQLSQRLNQIQEEAELRSYHTPQRPAQQQSFEDMFIENPEAAITMKADQIATAQRIREVAEEEYAKNPNEYPEKEQWVKRLALDPRYAHLAYSAKGVKKLFETAEVVRKQAIHRTAHQAIKELFGDNVDMDKLRSFFTSNGIQQKTTPQTNSLNAYMPDTGTSYRTGQDVNNSMNNVQKDKAEAIKQGDVGGVIGALLREKVYT